MNGMMIVNNLTGLLIVTSLLVIGVRRVRTSAWLYAVQSLVLVLIFVTLATVRDAGELYMWSISALITKVFLVPFVILKVLGPASDEEMLPGWLSPVALVLLAAVIMFVSWYAVSAVQLSVVAQLKPALAVSLGHFLLGLVCIVTQRNILKQIFGYCMMENGAHLTLAVMASKAPGLVEVGIATDAVFAVLVMAVLARKIHYTLQTLDVQQLTTLKG